MMLNLLAILSLLSHASLSSQPDGVRIGLFSLFNPRTIEARIAAGSSAKLDAGNADANRMITAGETIRARLEGDKLKITVSDSYGRPKQSFGASEARIAPLNSSTVELSVPGKIRRVVRGEVSISVHRSKAELSIVLATDRESAVAAIVAAELSGERATEAFKAMAVVARTYILSHRARHSDEGFDFCDTTHCQFYRGEQDVSRPATGALIKTAVAQTAGEYLDFQGRPIEGYYTAACGGLSLAPETVWGGTNASGYDYQPVACRWCRNSPYWRWERAASLSQTLDALSLALEFKLSDAAEILVEKHEASDMVGAVIIRDRGREERMNVEEFRRAIGRRLGYSTVISPSFTVERRGHRLVFRGRGFGSRVGFCMAGAIAQAKAGRGYREIVRFYFPKAELKGRLTND